MGVVQLDINESVSIIMQTVNLLSFCLQLCRDIITKQFLFILILNFFSPEVVDEKSVDKKHPRNDQSVSERIDQNCLSISHLLPFGSICFAATQFGLPLLRISFCWISVCDYLVSVSMYQFTVCFLIKLLQQALVFTSVLLGLTHNFIFLQRECTDSRHILGSYSSSLVNQSGNVKLLM